MWWRETATSKLAWDICIWKLLPSQTQQDVRVTHSSSRILNSWLNNGFSPKIWNNKINPTHRSINYGGCILMSACCQNTNKEQRWKHIAIQVWIMRWICIRSCRRWVSAIVNHFICKPHSSGRKQNNSHWNGTPVSAHEGALLPSPSEIFCDSLKDDIPPGLL